MVKLNFTHCLRLALANAAKFSVDKNDCNLTNRIILVDENNHNFCLFLILKYSFNDLHFYTLLTLTLSKFRMHLLANLPSHMLNSCIEINEDCQQGIYPCITFPSYLYKWTPSTLQAPEIHCNCQPLVSPEAPSMCVGSRVYGNERREEM